MEAKGVAEGMKGEPVFGPSGIDFSEGGADGGLEGTEDGACFCTGTEIVADLCAGSRGEGVAVDGWDDDPWPFEMRGIGVGRGTGWVAATFGGAIEDSGADLLASSADTECLGCGGLGTNFEDVEAAAGALVGCFEFLLGLLEDVAAALLLDPDAPLEVEDFAGGSSDSSSLNSVLFRFADFFVPPYLRSREAGGSPLPFRVIVFSLLEMNSIMCFVTLVLPLISTNFLRTSALSNSIAEQSCMNESFVR
jgi:hypothetical protein